MQKISRRAVIVAVFSLLFIFLIVGTASAAENLDGKVDAGGYLNVRSGPGTGYARVGSLTDGAAVSVTGVKKTSSTSYPYWYQIVFNGKPAWVAAQYVNIQAEAEVTAEPYLNVRSGPGTNYSNIGSLKKEALVTITDLRQTTSKAYPLWYKITYGSRQGWVAAEFVDLTVPALPEPGPEPPVQNPQPPPPPEPQPQPKPVLLSSVKPTEKMLGAVYAVKTVAVVNTSALNVRKGPGVDNERVGIVYSGNSVEIIDQAQINSNSYPLWYKIRYEDKEGWVAADFINATAGAVLYGLDYWGDGVKMSAAPKGLMPGEYRIDEDYRFFRIENGERVDSGIVYDFTQNFPYTRLLLDRPADAKIDAGLLASLSKAGTPFPGLAPAFMAAQEEWKVNVLFMMTLGAHESSWGTSWIAQNKNNLFGFGAYDNDPAGYATSFSSKEDCIRFVSGYIRSRYMIPGGSFYHGAHLIGINEKYASDPMWAFKIARYMEGILPFENYNGAEKVYNRGVATASGIAIAKAPGSSEALGTLNAGDKLEIAGHKAVGGNLWFSILFQGQEGWVSSQYVSLEDTPVAVVYFEDWIDNKNVYLNVRNGAGTSAGIVDKLYFGDKVNITGFGFSGTSLWLKVTYDGAPESAWIHGGYANILW